MKLDNPLKIILILILLSLSLPILAKKNDRNQPIEVNADRASYNQKSGQSEFFGHVVIRQGSLNIQATKVILQVNANKQQYITATGSPVLFRQQLDQKNSESVAQILSGQADKVTYNSQTGVAILLGHAKIQRGGDTVSGYRISYNTHDETYTVSSNQKNNKGRVSIIIQPNTLNGKSS